MPPMLSLHARFADNTVFLDSTSQVQVTDNVFLHDAPSALFKSGTTDIIMGQLDPGSRIDGYDAL